MAFLQAMKEVLAQALAMPGLLLRHLLLLAQRAGSLLKKLLRPGTK